MLRRIDGSKQPQPRSKPCYSHCFAVAVHFLSLWKEKNLRIYFGKSSLEWDSSESSPGSCWQNPSSTRTKNLLSSLLILLMAFLFIISSNMLGASCNHRIDVTASQHHSLSEQSKAILNDLQEPVILHAFFLSASAEEKFSHADGCLYRANITTGDLLPRPTQRPHIGSTIWGHATRRSHPSKRRSKTTSRFHLFRKCSDPIHSLLSQGRHHEICFSVGHQELLVDQFEPLGSMQNILNKLESQKITRAEILTLWRNKRFQIAVMFL